MDRGLTIAQGGTHDFRRRLLRLTVRVLTVAAVLCLLAEAGLRLAARPRLIGIGEHLVERDGYAVLPPLSAFAARNEEEQDIPIETDELGLRNAPGSLASADLLVLGDFFVVADHTAQDATLVGVLRRRGWKAYNAGLLGAGTIQAGRLLDTLLARSKPRVVVLAFSKGSDFYDNYWARQSADGRAADASAGWLGRLRRSGRSLCGRSALCRAAHGLIIGDLVRGRKRNPMGTVASAGMESFRTTAGPEMSEAVRKTDAALTAIAKRSAERGARFLILGIPSRAEVSKLLTAVDGCLTDARCPELSLALVRQRYSFDRPEETLAELARRQGIAYVSLLDIFRAAGVANVFHQADDRWNAAGQAMAAEALAAQLGPPGSP